MIREALRSCTALGLTETLTGKGTFVIANRASSDLVLGQFSARSLMEARPHIEVPAAEFAAKRRTAEQLEEMRGILALMAEEDDPEIWVSLDASFHAAIARASGNGVFERVVNDIRDAMAKQSETINLITGRARTSDLEHSLILDAIARGNTARRRPRHGRPPDRRRRRTQHHHGSKKRMTNNQFPAHAPLAVQTRGELVESVHFGSLIALATDGGSLLSRGEPGARVYPRSALKPLMAVAMLRAGLDLPADQLALAAASHSGSALHQETAAKILADAGLAPEDLRNSTDLPYGVAERRRPGCAPARAPHSWPRTAPASMPPCWPPASRTAGRWRATCTRSTRCPP